MAGELRLKYGNTGNIPYFLGLWPNFEGKLLKIRPNYFIGTLQG